MAEAPVIVWFRRDLRLGDHAALTAAVQNRRPVLPVFIHDETVAALGAAPKWRLGLAIEVLDASLRQLGSHLILRRGAALEVLGDLIAQTGAEAVYWSRYYEPAHIARDVEVKAALSARGIEARSFAGALLAEPRSVVTGVGRPYSVFTPFWRAVRARDPGHVLPAPKALRPFDGSRPESATIKDWRLSDAMGRGAAVVRPHLRIGEAEAIKRLQVFLDGPLQHYATARDYPALEATSGLSENLAWGEISPRQIWGAVMGRANGTPDAAGEKFLSELGWREFAWHQLAHQPDMAQRSWRRGWDGFAWRGDGPDAERWRQGVTGFALVDAGLREMYVTGRMHNRVRMVVASFLTKHLLTDWRIGRRWFEECLVDWDPASNALGWQWVAGSGPDAAPFFRIFNPELQAARFDDQCVYRRRFVAEEQDLPPETAMAYFRAVPRQWRLDPSQPYPAPVISLSDGRNRALAALKSFQDQSVAPIK